jgi:CcmD family protein
MIYLAMAYIIFWLIIFFYLLRLNKRLSRIEDELKEILRQKGSERGS